jgi:CRP-like cAMP-binding protein
MKDIHFFKNRNIQGQDLLDVCKELKYAYCEENEYIFKIGDVGDKFYLILSGEVAITIPKP